MEQIVPRWEWRTFAESIETRIDPAAGRHIRHVRSSEIYLIAAESTDNPKIRDGKIDIKALQAVNGDGLEQWRPVMKAGFPLSAEQAAVVCRCLKLVAPRLDRDAYDLEAFLAMIVAGGATAVRVDKVRDQYDLAGCSVEVADVTFDGERFRTLAVEDPDPAKVSATVATLGLGGRENVNFVAFIRQLKNAAAR